MKSAFSPITIRGIRALTGAIIPRLIVLTVLRLQFGSFVMRG
jgi:hypothetical protein